MKRDIALGDYVLASKYSNEDPDSPWMVGYVCKIIHVWMDSTLYVIGSETGKVSKYIELPFVRSIGLNAGKTIISERRDTRWGKYNGSNKQKSSTPSVS